MEKENISVSDELLIKYIQGETTVAEGELVDLWRATNAVNEKRFTSFQAVWDLSLLSGAKATPDVSGSWLRFSREHIDTAKPKMQRSKTFVWLAAAAILIFLAGLPVWLMTQNRAPEQEVTPTIVQMVPSKTVPVTEQAIADAEKDVTPPQPEPTIKPKLETHHAPKQKNNPPSIHSEPAFAVLPVKNKGESICNATDCAIEICITRTVYCPDGRPAAYSTCRRLDPDESGHLNLQVDGVSRNCSLAVREITITRLPAQETIVLNDNSEVTAEDFYNYMTGEKKGDVLAGVFQSGCSDNSKHRLKLDNNNYGHLILQ